VKKEAKMKSTKEILTDVNNKMLEKENVEKLRRRCRDALNKTASKEEILKIARILRVKID
jgi:cell shape-determining protein MreC